MCGSGAEELCADEEELTHTLTVKHQTTTQLYRRYTTKSQPPHWSTEPGELNGETRVFLQQRGSFPVCGLSLGGGDVGGSGWQQTHGGVPHTPDSPSAVSDGRRSEGPTSRTRYAEATSGEDFQNKVQRSEDNAAARLKVLYVHYDYAVLNVLQPKYC